MMHVILICVLWRALVLLRFNKRIILSVVTYVVFLGTNRTSLWRDIALQIIHAFKVAFLIIRAQKTYFSIDEVVCA